VAGPLELFYDLAAVVLVGQAAHRLARHLTWAGLGEFAVVFTLVQIVWVNGSLHHDLHGHEDARARSTFLLQILLLAGMGAFIPQAGGARGSGVRRNERGLAELPDEIRREVADTTEPTVATHLIDRIAGEVGGTQCSGPRVTAVGVDSGRLLRHHTRTAHAPATTVFAWSASRSLPLRPPLWCRSPPGTSIRPAAFRPPARTGSKPLTVMSRSIAAAARSSSVT
jgi:hypothetical protein